MDESTDITAQAQLLIFKRFLNESSITEELLACISFETTTRSEDIFNGINKFFTKNNLDWNKVIKCSMDGAPSLMEKNIGLQRILSREYFHIKINHCIIHCQNLASKDLSLNFSDVMQVVISTVNYVKARDLNSRMFKQLCITENSNHHTSLMHTAINATLEKVFLLFLLRSCSFLQDKGHKNVRYFHDPYFLARLALFTDIFKDLNNNTELQGKGKWVFDFQSSIKAFVSKIQILREGKTNNYSYFCHFQEFNATIDVDFHEELDLEEAKKDLLDYLRI